MLGELEQGSERHVRGAQISARQNCDLSKRDTRDPRGSVSFPTPLWLLQGTDSILKQVKLRIQLGICG